MKKITILFSLFCITLTHAQEPIIATAALRHNTYPQLFVDFRISEDIDLTDPDSDVIISYQIKDAGGIYSEIYKKDKHWSAYLININDGTNGTKYCPGDENNTNFEAILPAGQLISSSVVQKAWQSEGYLDNLKVVLTVKDNDGNTTTKELLIDDTAPADFTATAGTTTETSIELLLNSTDATGPITYNVTYGTGLTATTTEVSGTQKSLIISNLDQETAYSFSITAKDAYGNTTDPVLVNVTTQTKTFSISSNDFSKSATIYPNPAKDILHIESSSAISRIEFYSVIGTKVLESEVNHNSINLDLPNGVYILRMYTENNELAIKKLIIE